MTVSIKLCWKESLELVCSFRDGRSPLQHQPHCFPKDLESCGFSIRLVDGAVSRVDGSSWGCWCFWGTDAEGGGGVVTRTDGSKRAAIVSLLRTLAMVLSHFCYQIVEKYNLLTSPNFIKLFPKGCFEVFQWTGPHKRRLTSVKRQTDAGQRLADHPHQCKGHTYGIPSH